MITYYVIAHPNYSLIEPLTEPGLVRSNERLTEQMIAFVYLFIYDELLAYMDWFVDCADGRHSGSIVGEETSRGHPARAAGHRGTRNPAESEPGSGP